MNHLFLKGDVYVTLPLRQVNLDIKILKLLMKAYFVNISTRWSSIPQGANEATYVSCETSTHGHTKASGHATARASSRSVCRFLLP